MKRFAQALGLGFLAEFACAFVGFLGVIGSNTLGNLAEIIHTPSMAIGRLIFPESSRATIYRDVVALFVLQWAIYTGIILIGQSLWARAKPRA